MKTQKPSPKPAKHGEKMIEVKVRFFTNDIAEPGSILPKHAWTAGVVRMKPNKLHGITTGKILHFHSLMEIPAVIEKALIQQGIALRPGTKSKKYIEA